MRSSKSKQLRATATVSPAESNPLLTLSDFPAQSLQWLWPNRIPLGYLTLIAGEPLAGKSYLTLDIAARTSRGGPWPDETAENREADAESQRPGSVILLSAEDHWRNTITHRLSALGADLTKISVYFGGKGKSFDLGQELERLNALLNKLPDCRLIVVDPITAYLGNFAENSGALARNLIYPLSESVAERGIAVVLVAHLRRGKGKVLHRPTGGDALVRAARTAWLLGNESNSPERRLLLPIKNNLRTAATGLAFTIEPVGNGEYATLRWDPEPVMTSADDSFRNESHRPSPRDHKLCDAIDWLEGLLRHGTVPAADVQQAAKARGISYGTLRRAFEALEVESTKIVRDSRSVQVWQLPKADGQA